LTKAVGLRVALMAMRPWDLLGSVMRCYCHISGKLSMDL